MVDGVSSPRPAPRPGSRDRIGEMAVFRSLAGWQNIHTSRAGTLIGPIPRASVAQRGRKMAEHGRFRGAIRRRSGALHWDPICLRSGSNVPGLCRFPLGCRPQKPLCKRFVGRQHSNPRGLRGRSPPAQGEREINMKCRPKASYTKYRSTALCKGPLLTVPPQ